MTLQKSLRFSIAGALLLGVLPARAQLSAYNQDDLLLNFRDATTPTDPDVVIDLGNASAFVSAIQALPSGSAVLDAVTGVTPTPGYTTLFSGDDLFVLYGSPTAGNVIGFSAAASDQTTETIWLTRHLASPSAAPGIPSAQANSLNQGKTVNDIAGIGAGGLTGTSLNGGTPGSTAVVSSGNTHSYQTEAEGSVSLPNVISYQGTQNIAAPAGGLIETTQSGSAPIYEGLWEIPLIGAGSPVFQGIFTFAPSGEVDFTVASAITVPPTNQASLFIVTNGPNSVEVFWTNTGSFTLQQNSDLTATAGWMTSSFPVSSSNGTNSVTIAPPIGNLFFRLVSP